MEKEKEQTNSNNQKFPDKQKALGSHIIFLQFGLEPGKQALTSSLKAFSEAVDL